MKQTKPSKRRVKRHLNKIKEAYNTLLDNNLAGIMNDKEQFYARHAGRALTRLLNHLHRHLV